MQATLEKPRLFALDTALGLYIDGWEDDAAVVAHALEIAYDDAEPSPIQIGHVVGRHLFTQESPVREIGPLTLAVLQLTRRSDDAKELQATFAVALPAALLYLTAAGNISEKASEHLCRYEIEMLAHVLYSPFAPGNPRKVAQAV